jgi:hypothetical protein
MATWSLCGRHAGPDKSPTPVFINLDNVLTVERQGDLPRCRSAATAAGGNNAFSPHRHFQRNSPELVHIDDKFQAPQWR